MQVAVRPVQSRQKQHFIIGIRTQRADERPSSTLLELMQIHVVEGCGRMKHFGAAHHFHNLSIHAPVKEPMQSVLHSKYTCVVSLEGGSVATVRQAERVKSCVRKVSEKIEKRLSRMSFW